MIPKIIHYCWFGGNPLPELAQKCIASWKKFLPDYEIKEWNESNYDVRKIPYTAQAYDAKKYAFVSDYARFDILYQYGGVYFDTDVEVIKDLRPIIEKGAFIGVEKGTRPLLNAGLGIASPAASEIYREILDSYKTEQFVKQDGSLNLKTVCERVSFIFAKHGFVEKDCLQNVAETTIYPSDFFCPKSIKTGLIKLTDNSYTIHHYDGSWVTGTTKQLNDEKKWIVEHVKIPFLVYILQRFMVLKKIIKDCFVR
ncbi:glycosyltransferase family 32 protein [uncultured Treponema sp.]|uniref:glycosyltransferase family 32 protein n=1 Tax=uncultured Treponema sp. TaxID=162155 RepID=UPI0025D166CF|nr:glycosyltransferase [uncultured Treponema sp.]